jgi:hypothetical protein
VVLVDTCVEKDDEAVRPDEASPERRPYPGTNIDTGREDATLVDVDVTEGQQLQRGRHLMP